MWSWPRRAPTECADSEIGCAGVAARFGRPFLVFLNASDAVADMDRILGKVREDSLAHTLSLDMPRKERRVIMEVVDSLYEETDREGARSAYLAFFGRSSWEDEEELARAQLAARASCAAVRLAGSYTYHFQMHNDIAPGLATQCDERTALIAYFGSSTYISSSSFS